MFTSHQFELHFLLPTFIDAEQRRRNVKGNRASRKWTNITPNTDHSLIFNFWIQLFDREFYSIKIFIELKSIIKIDMSSNTSINLEGFDVFFLEQLSNEPSLQRNNSPNNLNSTEKSDTHTARMPSFSSIATPETSDLNSPWQFNWAHNAIGIRTAAPNCSTELEWPEFAGQSIYHPGNNGSGKPYRGWK